MLDRTREQAQEYMLLNQDTAGAGWLIYDYRGSNPIFRQVVGEEIGRITRPCFLLIQAEEEPQVLTHHVDAGKFKDIGIDTVVYHNRHTMVENLARLLKGNPTVAMEYSPMASLPRASRVDAGVVELVQSLGLEVVSSADLVQHATQRWGEEQLASHKESAGKIGRIVLEAFEYIGMNLVEGVDEYQVAEFIRSRFKQESLEAPDGPIVAANENSSDPHYDPSPNRSLRFAKGGWVLIDLWAREATGGSVYADITWVAYVGDQVPGKNREVFQAVTGARDRAVKYLEEVVGEGNSPRGRDVDKVARDYISQRGYGDHFTHRLGHSISSEVHGDAVNLDSFETDDVRHIIPGICFSIEPGIYLPEFGVRSEIDVFMSDNGPVVTTPAQRDIVLING